jgi:hypothetical protein
MPKQPVLLLSSWAYREEGAVCREQFTYLGETVQLDLENGDRMNLYSTIFNMKNAASYTEVFGSVKVFNICFTYTV